jgi:hypothetical protein
LFGWTILGWIAALIWAIVEKPVERSSELEFDEATGFLRHGNKGSAVSQLCPINH